jgi:TetR/AcrR family transcriptional repressor of lmrAB and yxaGH operons
MMNGIVKRGVRVASDTRDRMVRAAVELFRERGYAATSFADVIERSGAPRGSIYHHFPRGKEQLAAEALQWYAESTARWLRRAMAAGSPAGAVRAFITGMRDGLLASGFRESCPIAAVTLDLTPEDDTLPASVAGAFTAWRTVLAAAFARDGATPAQARRLASFVVAAVEGALILARAERDVQPLTDVAQELVTHVRDALAQRRPAAPSDPAQPAR